VLALGLVIVLAGSLAIGEIFVTMVVLGAGQTVVLAFVLAFVLASVLAAVLALEMERGLAFGLTGRGLAGVSCRVGVANATPPLPVAADGVPR
jgi:hypothetical protein